MLDVQCQNIAEVYPEAPVGLPPPVGAMESFGRNNRQKTMLISPIRQTRKLARQLRLARKPARREGLQQHLPSGS